MIGAKSAVCGAAGGGCSAKFYTSVSNGGESCALPITVKVDQL